MKRSYAQLNNYPLSIIHIKETMAHSTTQNLPLAELYERDFNLWIEKNLRLLSAHKYHKLDLDNLLEEIEDMARRDKDALESNLKIVLLHLLKWKYQPEMRSGSWEGSIVEHRQRIRKTLKKSPSLKNYMLEVFPEAYQDAIKVARAETRLDISTFPPICEWEIEQVLDEDWVPD